MAFSVWSLRHVGVSGSDEIEYWSELKRLIITLDSVGLPRSRQ